MKNHYYKEHRKQVRAKMHNTVVGILNSNVTVTIGTIIDISLGGVKCANYEIRMEPDNRNSVDSIDLIAGSYSILGLPCKPIWESEGESEGNSVCELTPKQIFLLKKFIDICVSEGLISSTSRTPITVEEE
jgi:hypothetical protein